MLKVLTKENKKAPPVHALLADSLKDWLKTQPDSVRHWLKAMNFTATAGAVAPWPGEDGGIGGVVLGLGRGEDPWSFAALPAALPPGTYRLAGGMEPEWAALSWALACYDAGRHRKGEAKTFPKLVWPEGCDRAAVESAVLAANLARDLINMPAGDLGPKELAGAAKALAEEFSAHVSLISGKELEKDYPAIHAVGKGSPRAPRLINLRWGKKGPRVTLVGKGVCFDSGGLDIKPASSMKLMKKDMGGAAHALALARMIMAANLPIRLRVLIPAVENAVSGEAYRPMDVVKTRKGVTIEVGHTDAEGRVVLADALTAACEDKPDLVIDLATLTGAARSALGPDIPALFTDDEALARDLVAAGETTHDPLWRLPLWSPYRSMIEGRTADLTNSADSPFAGAITAALFLKEFVAAESPWVHIDLYAWSPTSRPGRPEGGAAQALRALFATISSRYGKK